MGGGEVALGLLERACALDLPLLLDADALNLLAAESRLQRVLAERRQRPSPLLLTPHPSEAARLLGADTSVEPYYEQSDGGFVIYGGDIASAFSGDSRSSRSDRESRFTSAWNLS